MEVRNDGNEIHSGGHTQHMSSLLLVDLGHPAKLVESAGCLEELAAVVADPGLAELERQEGLFVC